MKRYLSASKRSIDGCHICAATCRTPHFAQRKLKIWPVPSFNLIHSYLAQRKLPSNDQCYWFRLISVNFAHHKIPHQLQFFFLKQDVWHTNSANISNVMTQCKHIAICGEYIRKEWFEECILRLNIKTDENIDLDYLTSKLNPNRVSFITPCWEEVRQKNTRICTLLPMHIVLF